jgi:hypothetical protein
MINDQAVPDSEARLPDEPRGAEDLLAKDGVLGEGLHPGTREIREETTTRAAGLAQWGCDRRLDKPASRTRNAPENFTPVPEERQEHGPHEAVNPAPMEA